MRFTFLLFISLTWLTPVPAFSQENIGISDDRSGIVVSTTPPILMRCSESAIPRAACFRVFVRIRSDSSPIAVSWIESNYVLSETTAFADGGASCTARMENGPPAAPRWSNGEVTVPENASVVSISRPIQFPLAFYCDQGINPTEHLNIQITLVVGTGHVNPYGHQVGKNVHFGYDNVTIKPSSAKY